MRDRAPRSMGTVHAVVGRDIATHIRKLAAASHDTTSALIKELVVEALMGRGLLDADRRPMGRTTSNRPALISP